MVGGIVLLFHLLGLGSSIHAVMVNRTAQGAIAWGVSLNTFPYLAVPLYWIFGRPRFEGYVESWTEQHEKVKALEAELAVNLAPFAVPEVEGLPDYEAMKKIARLPLLRGNTVDLLVDGEATFASVLDGLARAKRYALVQFYIVHDDRLGRRLKAAMIDCAKRGLEVYFIYDEIGSVGLPRAYLSELEDAGVHVSEFNSTQGGRHRFQINFRNHRKSVIVDGRETWLGGHNVGDEYMGEDPKIGRWRDTHVHVVGPAAQMAQIAFVADWYWAKRTLPELDWTPVAAAGDADVMTMVVPFSPTDRLETAQMFFVLALSAAKERIWIATPYFVPDQAVLAALRLAAMRGIDVRIIVPAKSDNLVIDLATRWFMSELDGLGIRFFRYSDGFMHQKVFLVDDKIATVGSTNFDNRSFRLQFEINALLVSAEFGAQIEAMLQDDFAHSKPYDPQSLGSASYLDRLGVSLARLAAPLL